MPTEDDRKTPFRNAPKPDPDLIALLESTRGHVMTQAEGREQAISFAFGNGKLSGLNITREGVARAYDRREKEDIDHAD